MGQARLDYMKDSAWKRGTAKKIDNLPPFELPYAKDAVLIDLVDPDVLPDAQVNFLEMIEVRSTLRQYDDTKELSNKELSYLLWCTQGVKMMNMDNNDKVARSEEGTFLPPADKDY